MKMAKLEIVRAEYQGLEVSFTDDGWFNATVAAERFGKRVQNWMRLKETQAYFSAVVQHSTHSHLSELIKTKEGNQGGTWIHSDLVISFGRWISPDFAVWCDQQIKSILQRTHPHYDRQARRIQGKVVRRELTDAIKTFDDYAMNQNKEHKHPYYSNFSRATNKALFILEKGAVPINFRDLLDGIQLLHVGSAESIIIKTIYDEMEKETYYKEIFIIARDRVNAFGESVGKTVPGNHKALRPAPTALEA
jgi:hypothetical protein